MSIVNRTKPLSLVLVCLLGTAFTLNLALTSPEVLAQGKAESKLKGRLPAYYKDLVDEKQKEAIYKVQADFKAKIDALEEQLKQLADDRDAAIEKILTADQKTKLQKAKDEAAGKKKKPAKSAEKEE